MNIEKEYIRKVEKLVPCPEIALKVLEIAHQDDCNINQLAKKIEQDPNLTANMLRFANSAYFGHMRKITSITDIILRLGLESVKIIAITSASVGLLRTPQDAYNLATGALWRHSYATAILASIIAKYANEKDLNTIYTAALLHDIGKLILNRPLQLEILNAHFPLERNFRNIIEFEQSILHTNHAKIGRMLLEQWGLPSKITTAVGAHHEWEDIKAHHQMACKIVALSNAVVESMGIHAVDSEDTLFSIKEFIETEQDMPEVPNFTENMEAIVSEFYEAFSEATTIEFETM